MNYKGYGKDRTIQLNNNDYEVIRDQIEGIDHISPQFNIWGNTSLSYNDEFGNFTVQCILPSHQYVQGTDVVTGRYINEIDIEQRRKVICIGKGVHEALFKMDNPIGKYVKLNGIRNNFV